MPSPFSSIQCKDFRLDAEGEQRWHPQPLFWHARSVNRYIPAIVVTVVALLVAGTGYYLYERFSPVGQAMAELRDTPLVGLAISDHPEVEPRLRKAIKDEQINPTLEGPTRPLVVVSELRRELLAPTLRGADDATATAAMAARVAIVTYLQKADPAACREFATGGIAHVDRLDAEAQRLFRDLLTAMEAAYRSGRKAPTPPPRIMNRQEMNVLLQRAGFTKADFDKLANFGTLSNAVSCEVELKIDSAPMRIEPEWRGPFARFIIAQ